jgi:DMSO/TMAO reductase YedYZ molybdopterin-dependent catalytic subunit
MANTKKTRLHKHQEQGASNSNFAGDIESPSRRSLLSWLGNATVLALTADLVAACAPETTTSGISRSRETNTATPAGSGTFTFAPSPEEGAIYDQWWGNTVDRQNLEYILSSWQLNVSGLVEEAITLSFAEMLALPRQDQVTDFHCVEGWSVYDVPWNGFHIDRLIDLVRPTSEATHITLRSVGDIYTESVPLTVAREPRTLFAYGIGGGTLPLTHGFPLRLVLPRMYGYKNAKWVKQIEFTNAGSDGYWEQRGYPSDAPVKASRLRAGKY